MVETTTLHYGFTKPELTKSASTWGGFLNGDLDSIDALVFANQQGIVPIGSITMFGGATAPANWLLCDGSSLDTTAYAGLFAVLGYTYGGSGPNFNLPNLTQKFPMGGGTPGATGGAATVTLDATMIPAHTHTASQAAHTHPGSYQDAHVHAITTGNHAHNLNLNPHTHGTNIMRFIGSGGTLGVGVTPNNVSVGNVDAAGNFSGSTDTQPGLTGNADSRQPALHIDTQQPAVTVANTGGGLPHPNLPPYLTVSFIIRYM